MSKPGTKGHKQVGRHDAEGVTVTVVRRDDPQATRSIARRHKSRTHGASGRLHLHHAVPRSVCPPEARKDLRNGIALCTSCHSCWHAGSLVLSRQVFTADEWAYISTLRLTGRSIDGWLDRHYP